MAEWNENLVKKVLNTVISRTPSIEQRSFNKNNIGRWTFWIDEIAGGPGGYINVGFLENGLGFKISRTEHRNKSWVPTILYSNIEKLFGYSLKEAEAIRTFTLPNLDEVR